jgi:hypothetical protein
MREKWSYIGDNEEIEDSQRAGEKQELRIDTRV